MEASGNCPALDREGGGSRVEEGEGEKIVVVTTCTISRAGRNVGTEGAMVEC